MNSLISRRSFVSALALGAMFALGGCSSSGSSDSAASSSEDEAKTVNIGTLATEDILPYWVAESEGLFDKAGLSASIVQFQSATELIAGVSSNSVDLAMTDPMVAASLYAGGTDLKLAWVTLGTTADQGRFGIMTGPDSTYSSLADLAGVPIGVGTNTILEYVMDKLMERAGVPADQVVVEELQKLPVRYQAMVSGEVAAAALPGSLLALGEASGCKLIADDTTGENISQSVMIVRNGYMEKAGADDAYAALESVWNQAVDLVNANPENYRDLLVENANLNDAVAETYPICTYPYTQIPSSEAVDPVLEWMLEKGYLSKSLNYDETTGAFSA